MTIIKLGLSKAAIDAASETYEGRGVPFPANKVGYTKYTARVTDLQIKEGSGKTEGRAWLWIQVTNGVHQESILVDLDPSNVGPSVAPEKIEATVKRNLETLTRALKVLEITNDTGDLDTSKLKSAIGKLVSFGVRQGDMQPNGYYKYSTTFYGKAEELIPLVDSGKVPVAGAEDDVPF